uniref:Uncharacterized protein n=1 Tax=Anguilla anguilla TaxID=7936 RepID=A0A0E9RKV0_ANGAN
MYPMIKGTLEVSGEMEMRERSKADADREKEEIKSSWRNGER